MGSNSDIKEIRPIKKGSLMIVDDDIAVLKTLEKILGAHYDIAIVENGEKALDLLKRGFKPDVILSDQVMPGITGAEFLEKSIEFSPDSVKVILTGQASPKDIIAAINQAHAYMFLTKPWDNVQLVQAIRLCFDHFKLQTQNKALNIKLAQTVKDLEEKTANLVKTENEDKQSFSQIANSLSQLISSSEHWYFTPHTSSVVVIARTIAEEMSMKTDFIANLVIASLLHNIGIISMPLRLQLIDIDEAVEKDRNEYLTHFNNRVIALTKFSKLAKAASMVSTIWENHDGTGYPLGLSGMQLSKESQIISIANIYHNKVYRVLKEEYEKGKSHSVIIQNAEQTLLRHNEALKFFYRRASWFDVDIMNTFHNIVKKKAIPQLIPPADSLEIYLDDDGYRNYNAKPVAQKSIEKEIVPEKEEEKQSGPRMIEKEIQVDQLQAGMISGQTVVTKAGILIVRADTTLDATMVRNIKAASNSGMFSQKITIMVQAN